MGLDFAAYPDVLAVKALVDKVDDWIRGQDVIKKIVFRLPRDPGPAWAPVIARASRVMITTDDLMSPLPAIAPPLADVLRIVRPDPDLPFRMVSRIPYFTLPRSQGPTDDFWRTGDPWIFTQE